ncbi:MAG: 30S ribosome-binding factor RbfA [Bacteroidaceae bacterium]|jgi:ribosome-binding factor A|nr:30S ribosome-binding factor RbfA [Bacteroidaceae bacterium]
MDSTRQNKISRLIQKELSEILLRLQKETRGIMVSVSAVRVSPDLGIAKAYLSVFPSEKGNEVVEHLNTNIKAIRFELGNKVRHQLRIIPEIKFFIDDSLDYIENIDKLLKE